MFFRLYTLVVVSLTAGGVLALPAPNSGTLAPWQNFTGKATYFLQHGRAGACGHVHQDTDHVVALQTHEYANGKHCGARITIMDKDTGKTAIGVVADECPGCDGSDSIDLSEGLFKEFAPLKQGVFPVSWHF